ncbi:MAG: hypothetical protein ABH879_02195 [archaeon]
MVKKAAKKQSKKPKGKQQIAKQQIVIKKQSLYYAAGIILAAILVFCAIKFVPSDAFQAEKNSCEQRAKLDFYVMSQCPYGTQVEDAIKPVLNEMGDCIDFTIDYIAAVTPDGFMSLHGQPEVDENIRQVCAMKYYPDTYMDYIVCQNRDIMNAEANWEQCATDNGLDPGTISKCSGSEEGTQLHTESIARSQAVGASGSPTIYLDDEAYRGGRDSLSFQRAICNKLVGHPGCAGIPECAQDADCTAQPDKIAICNVSGDDAKCEYQDPVRFQAIVLNDKDCTTCSTQRIVDVNNQLFKGAEHKYVDVSSSEGKALIEKYAIEVVPAYLYEEKIITTYSWTQNPNIPTAFEKKGDMLQLKDEVTGSMHYVSEEARQALLDALGIDKADGRPQIDFFVMSYCPYGNMAEEAIEPVFRALGNKAIFNPRYVIYENYGGGGPDYCLEEGQYCSMHGIQELNQDIRELCVARHQGAKAFFEFTLAMNSQCSSQNADACWVGVAESLELDAEQIRQCEKDEGADLVKQQKDLNSLLGVSGSPTVYVEGQLYSGSRTAQGYLDALCAGFAERPAECGIGLGDAEAAPAGGCG